MNSRITGRVRKRRWTAKDGKERTGWEYIVNLDPKPITRGGYRLKGAAEAALETELTERNNGTWVEPSRTTLETFIKDEWLPVVKDQKRATTYDLYRRMADLHIVPEIGHLPLQSVRPKDVRDLYAKHRAGRPEKSRKPLGRSSLHNVHTTLHSALRYAVDVEQLRRNPADRAEPRGEDRDDEEVSYWSPEQVAAFLDRVDAESAEHTVVEERKHKSGPRTYPGTSTRSRCCGLSCTSSSPPERGVGRCAVPSGGT